MSIPEVLVSAVVLVLIALGALTALTASGRAGAEERHRTQAHAIAQDDQARLRSLRISSLGNLVQSQPMVEGGNTYTVSSRGDFVSDSTGTASCTEDSASADYIKISSTVTWPSIGSRPPVRLESIVAPPNGSIGADHGALAISVQNALGEGTEGVAVSGTGPASFNGVTGTNGCIIFGNLPAGSYTVTSTVPGLVDNDGNAGGAKTASVVALSTNTLVLQYDEPGSLDVDFTTRASSGILVDSSADAVVVFNTGMTLPKTFGTPGTPASTVTATPLFPFTSPDTVYAGTCSGDNPTSGDALANATIPSGSTAGATIQLPALHLTVWSGNSSSSQGSPVPNARVRIGDKNCVTNGVPFRRTFFTNSDGKLSDPGLPWSVYDVCAQNSPTNSRARTQTNVSVKNLTTGTTVNLYVGSNAPSGTCA